MDFIGIKNGEAIDFIEVKSSLKNNKHQTLFNKLPEQANISLTEEEKEIQRLIQAGAVNFRLVVVKDEVFN